MIDGRHRSTLGLVPRHPSAWRLAFAWLVRVGRDLAEQVMRVDGSATSNADITTAPMLSSPAANARTNSDHAKSEADQRGRDLRMLSRKASGTRRTDPEPYPRSVQRRRGKGGRDVGKRNARGPLVLKTPPGTSEYRMWRDEEADPPTRRGGTG